MRQGGGLGCFAGRLRPGASTWPIWGSAPAVTQRPPQAQGGAVAAGNTGPVSAAAGIGGAGGLAVFLPFRPGGDLGPAGRACHSATVQIPFAPCLPVHEAVMEPSGLTKKSMESWPSFAM